MATNYYIKNGTVKTEVELKKIFEDLRSDSSTDFERDYAKHEFGKWLKDKGYEITDNPSDSIFNVVTKESICTRGFTTSASTWREALNNCINKSYLFNEIENDINEVEITITKVKK